MIFQFDQYRWNIDYKELLSTYPDQISLWLWQISSFYREQFGQHPEPEIKEKFECKILDWPLVNPYPRNLLYLQHHYVNLISVIINLLASCSHSYPPTCSVPLSTKTHFPSFTGDQIHLYPAPPGFINISKWKYLYSIFFCSIIKEAYSK